MKIKYKTGQVINKLIFIKELRIHINPNGSRKRKAVFKCYCGQEFEAEIYSIKSGNTNSCGCYKKQMLKKAHTKHGLRKHPLYEIWAGMKSRCYNINDTGYKYYGGRGINVCKQWDSFNVFYKDMGTRPEGTSIDRIDNDGNYEPQNCKWSTPKEQMSNRRV